MLIIHALVARFRSGTVHFFLTISRTLSLMPPTAFWILPAVRSALPSDCDLPSPTALPTASLTDPLISWAAPAIRSLSMTACSCHKGVRYEDVSAGREVGEPPQRAGRTTTCPSKSAGLPAAIPAIAVAAIA